MPFGEVTVGVVLLAGCRVVRVEGPAVQLEYLPHSRHEIAECLWERRVGGESLAARREVVRLRMFGHVYAFMQCRAT